MIQSSSQMWCSAQGPLYSQEDTHWWSLFSHIPGSDYHLLPESWLLHFGHKGKHLKLQSSPTSHTRVLKAKLRAKRAPTHNCSLSLPVDTMLWKLWEVGNYSHPFNQGYSLRCLNTMLFKNGHFYIKGIRKSTARMYCISDWISFSCRNM